MAVATAAETQPLAAPRKRSIIFRFRSSLERKRSNTRRSFRSRFSYPAALRAFSPRVRGARSTRQVDVAWISLWEAISNGGDISPEDEVAILACERWRRKVHGERNDLWTRLASTLRNSRTDWARLTSGIRAGVPASLRGSVWYACSGAASKKQKAGMSYAELVKLGLQLRNEAANVIEVDLPRTGVGEHQMGQLRHILLAFAAKNPGIGYCQSMNFITKTLLLYNEEERTFWILCSLIEEILPAGYYTQTMSGLRSDLRLLDSLIGQYMPNLKSHLVQRGIDLAPITMNWFLCLFVNTLPAEQSHRVLDCLLHEGPKVLFRAALSILHIREAELLKVEAVVDAYLLLRAPFGSGPQGAGELTAASPQSDLLGSMYGLWLKGLSTDTLTHLREEHLKGIQADDAAHSARKQAMRKVQDAERTAAAEVPSTETTIKVPPSEPAQLRKESFALIDKLPVQPDGLGFAERARDSPHAAATWLAHVTGDEVDEAESSPCMTSEVRENGRTTAQSLLGEERAKQTRFLQGDDNMEGHLWEEDDRTPKGTCRSFAFFWCCQRAACGIPA